MNTQPYGMIWEDAKLRISRLKEAIHVMKMLWKSSSNNPVSFKGQFYNLTNAHLDLSPLQKPFPRIYMGAFRSPTLLKFIGEQLDVLFHDIDSGKFGNDAKTSNFYINRKAVKDKYPKS